MVSSVSCSRYGTFVQITTADRSFSTRLMMSAISRGVTDMLRNLCCLLSILVQLLRFKLINSTCCPSQLWHYRQLLLSLPFCIWAIFALQLSLSQNVTPRYCSCLMLGFGKLHTTRKSLEARNAPQIHIVYKGHKL